MCSVYTGETAAAVHPRTTTINARMAAPVPVQALMLPDRVGYLRLDYFWPMARAASAIGSAFDQLATAEALVIDLRANAGGDTGAAALLGSLLFDTEPAFLNETYQRGPVRVAPALVAATRLISQPVIVLLSGRSSREAWEFARNLRTVGRVVIAGELPAVAQRERGAAVDIPLPEEVALRRSHVRLASADR